MNQITWNTEDAMIAISGILAECRKYYVTNVDGKYAFNSLPKYEDYNIELSKNDDPLNGVTTQYIVLIIKTHTWYLAIVFSIQSHCCRC